MDPRRKFGDSGERLAEAFLRQKGWRVLARQWRGKRGEVDLVCESPDGEVVFVEVKTRRTLGSGFPEESVTKEKLSHLERAAEEYLRSERLSGRPYRFDVIAITVTEGAPQILHIEGV